MNTNFTTCMDFVKSWEGGLSDKASDRGGLTKFGITLGLVQSLASTQPGRNFLQQIDIVLPVARRCITELTFDQARSIYAKVFWLDTHINELPLALAHMVFDFAVNAGESRAVRYVQESLNAHGAELKSDGKLGPKSLSACANLNGDSQRSVLTTYHGLRQAHYERLAETDATQRANLNGWTRRNAACLKASLALIGA